MKENFSAEELRALIKKVPLGEILNKKGILYKERREELDKLSPEELVQEMAKEPRLIRRPLIILDDRVLVGYNEAQYSEAFE